MQRSLRIVVIAVLAGAMVAGPVASASSVPHVRLSVLPLPASLLGSAAGSLQLEHDSGVIRNKGSYLADHDPLYPNRLDVKVNDRLFGRLHGRVSGYALDYGLGASGGAGVTEVWTSVDEYKTSAAAKAGLARWKLCESPPKEVQSPLTEVQGVLTATSTKEKAARVGSARFAVLAAYSGENVTPLFGLDEQFTVGRYEADVTVWAGSATAAKNLAARLAKKLDARIKQELAGTLRAKPVTLPSNSAPPDGPNLAPLGLQPTDLSGPPPWSGKGGYQYWGSYPFTVYSVGMQTPGPGQVQRIGQSITWYPTANEARFESDSSAALLGPSPLDLSGIGDGAWGSVSGVALLEFSSGQIREVVRLSHSSGRVQASQAVSLAQIVANRINAAGLGS